MTAGKNGTRKNARGGSGAAAVAFGVIIGLAIAAAAVWATIRFMPAREPAEAIVEEAPAAAAEPAAPVGYSAVRGPAPGAETPYDGGLLAYARWRDADGEHLVSLSAPRPEDGLVTVADVSPHDTDATAPDADATIADAAPTPPDADATGPESDGTEPHDVGDGEAGIQARHYLNDGSGWSLAAERFDPMPAGAVAGYYGDAPWVGDFDGDGLGEALAAYWIDESPEAGAKRLALLAFTAGAIACVDGSTRYDPADAPRVAPRAVAGDGWAALPAAIRGEAARLWSAAQFDLAEPPAFPDFAGHARFDGAALKGENPFWNLTVLPPYALLEIASEGSPAVIRYASIAEGEDGLVIDGDGEVGGWSHRFRITIREQPVVAPDGSSYPLSVTIDWSDGTRYSGWGSLAE